MSLRAMAATLGISKSQVDRDVAAGMPMVDEGHARAWRLANRSRGSANHLAIDPPPTSAVLLELRRLSDLCAAIRDEQEHLHRRLIAREDARLGAVLLPLAADVHGGDFAPAELVAVGLNDRTSSGQALRELLGDFVDADGGFRGLAWLFRRIEGATLGGHRLVRVGECRLGRRYRVQVVGR